MLRPLYRSVRKNILHHLIPTSRAKIFAGGKEGVEVVGFFHSASGIGESARLCARQLQNMGIKVRCTSVENMFSKPTEIAWKSDAEADDDQIGCRIFHLNPPMMPPVAIKMGLKKFARVYNIGYWAWELEKIPAEWMHATRYVNAVFCPSDFTSQTIRNYTDKSVETVPHPVALGEPRANTRQRLGLSDNAFVISSLFSFGSALERKNPYAAVDAFIDAFSGMEHATLIFKSNHGGHSSEKEQFLNYIKPYPTIRLIDDIWEKDEVLGLIQTSDLYLSLHRSEGFGLPIAEAMLIGTPTMVTNWSGSRDFCNDSNSFLVPYTLIPVKSQHPEFSGLDNVVWADPDPAAAATILRKIYGAKEIARSKADHCLHVSNQYFSEPRYIQALEKLKKVERVLRPIQSPPLSSRRN